MMEAERTSETLVNFYQSTRRYNPEDSQLREPQILLSEPVWGGYSLLRSEIRNPHLLIALMMEAAARTSETLVNFYQTTRRYNPEDSHLNLNFVWLSIRLVDELFVRFVCMRQRDLKSLVAYCSVARVCIKSVSLSTAISTCLLT
jgi:hypothetical protein